MIKYSDIKIVYEQQRLFLQNDESLKRESLASLPTDNNSHALVISGIRRCGKSTLMRQRIGSDTEDAFYLNFDTPKLFRFAIRDVLSLKTLLLYLAGNFGNSTSANKLANLIGIKTAKTVSEYLGFFEEAYLVHQIAKFSWSLKVQAVNPKKIYFIDTALAKEVTLSFTENSGHQLENLVYWELRRQYKYIYYFYENNSECDFVVCQEKTPVLLVQVCHLLNGDNQQREVKGLREAMRFFKMNNGLIITMNQTDKIRTDEGWIQVLPAYHYFKEGLPV